MLDSQPEILLPKQKKKEDHFLEEIQKTSFFDNPSEQPTQKLFSPSSETINVVKICEQSPMLKLSNSANKLKGGMIYLSEDVMFYGSKVDIIFFCIHFKYRRTPKNWKKWATKMPESISIQRKSKIASIMDSS